MKLDNIVQKLNELFGVKLLEKDPAMTKFIPMVYDPIGFDWPKEFESDFVSRANGLMVRGSDEVSCVYCSVFPGPEVLQAFLEKAQEGDLLFLHHPVDMLCGDPRGKAGLGFQPIDPESIAALKEKKLSVYTCHAPMDCHEKIGTNAAIIEALGAKVVGEFLPYGNGFAGKIVSVSPTSTAELVERLKEIFKLPYVDLGGPSKSGVTRMAIVAGGGTDVKDMKEAESRGAQVYLSGEIVNRVDNDYGRQQRKEDEEFASTTQMSLIGVSHAASEFLVMEKQLIPWFERELGIKALALPLAAWWR